MKVHLHHVFRVSKLVILCLSSVNYRRACSAALPCSHLDNGTVYNMIIPKPSDQDVALSLIYAQILS